MKKNAWLIGSNNAKKVEEMAAILEGAGLELVTLHQADIYMNVEEWGDTFAQNAALKSLHFAFEYDGVCVSDDSGLSVDGLNGAPGVHSARYAGPEATDEDNNQHLQAALEGREDDERRARYHAVIALACPADYKDPRIVRLRKQMPPKEYHAFEAFDEGPAWRLSENAAETLIGQKREMDLWLFAGEWEGRIATTKKGHGGFGYDPWFVLPDGRHVAELSDEEKNQNSHRAKALRLLDAALQ